jgi:hypothetical protein
MALARLRKKLDAEGVTRRRLIYLDFFTRRGSPGGARSARSDEGSAEHAHVARTRSARSR